jgi:hypothetical protein
MAMALRPSDGSQDEFGDEFCRVITVLGLKSKAVLWVCQGYCNCGGTKVVAGFVFNRPPIHKESDA